MTKNENVTELWTLYQKGLEYQNIIGMREKIPMHVRFYQGEQWPKATEATKNLPRPVVNIIKMICRNKKAAILSSVVKILFKSYGNRADTDKFNRFAEHVLKELKQDKLDKDAIDDAVKKGSYFYHYYWDSEAEGVDGEVEGALRAEIIDPLNIFFENPCQLDEQKQGWILIASRENVNTVQAIADKKVDKSLITADTYDNNAYNQAEQDENQLCTVLTRYFHKNGEVYCEKATKSCIVKEAFPITPNINKARSELLQESEDAPNNAFADDISKGNDIPKAKLYPIVAGYYEKRDGSIYGLSEIEGLIPNQKAINFNIAMSLLNAQECAWGKYVALPNALKGQKITNTPGQVLIDYSETGTGIKKLAETAMHSLPLEISDSLIGQTRNVAGATELLSGEITSANMSGAAIAQLQAHAEMPIEELRNEFWEVKKKQGLVIAQFLKSFYFKRVFEYEEENATTNKLESKQDEFSSKDFSRAKFDVVVEAGQGTRSSISADIAFLDNNLAKGAISIETYIKAYPDSAISNKSEIIKAIRAEKESQIAIANNVIEQQKAQIEEQAAAIAEMQKTVDSISSTIKENKQLNALNAELSDNYNQIAKKYALMYEMARQVYIEAKKQGIELEELKAEHELFAREILKNNGESANKTQVP